jgi:hypothetical protein
MRNALNLPVWTPSGPLVHVGSMRSQDKGVRGDSYEGHGISVSECPDAWVAIARLGGLPHWSLTKPAMSPSRFLDWHAVSDEARQLMVSWAVGRGLARACQTFEVSWLDTELDCRVSSSFEDGAKARDEHEFMVDEYEGAPEGAPELLELSGYTMTPAGLRALARVSSDPSEAGVLSAILYCESTDFFDGVYWADELDEAALSAPRAVIFPERLRTFDVRPHQAVAELASAPRRARMR